MGTTESAVFCERRSRLWTMRAVASSECPGAFRRCVGMAARWHSLAVRALWGDETALRTAARCV